MKEIRIKGRKVVGGKATGEAVVSPEPLCFLGGVDVQTGIVTEKEHAIEGQSMAGKVLIFPIGRGSTGGAYLIYETASNGKGPAAVINLKADPVTAVGCIIAGIPMLVEPEQNPLEVIRDGDLVEVNADEEVIIIRRI